MAAAQPAAALAERPARPFAARANVSGTLAAFRARPGLGPAAPCAARLRGPPLAPGRAGIRPSPGEGDHRFAGAAASARRGPAGPAAAGTRPFAIAL